MVNLILPLSVTTAESYSDKRRSSSVCKLQFVILALPEEIFLGYMKRTHLCPKFLEDFTHQWQTRRRF